MERNTEKTRDIRVLSKKRYRNSDHREFFIKFESGLLLGRTQSLQAHRDFELYFREDYIFNGYLRKSFLEELRTKAKIRSIDKYHSMLYSIPYVSEPDRSLVSFPRKYPGFAATISTLAYWPGFRFESLMTTGR